MDSRFWHQRWETGQIGFHEFEPNRHLLAHASRLGEERRVLVPLCGKSVDLTYLAALGHRVVGVELVERAVRDFFSELGGTPTVTKQGPFARYEAEGIVIFAGDFFQVTRDQLGPVDAVYDRAALIALPEPMRRDYAKHLRALLPPGAPGLLVSLDYEQSKMDGPPFSVPEAEVRSLYEGLTVEVLDAVRAGGNPRLQQVGASETVFAITF